MLRAVCNAVVLVALVAACAAVFVLHSLYFIFRYAESSTKNEVKTVLVDQIEMPALVICNRMPFSQDGLTRVSSSIRQENSIRYLREWTNPSMRESADFFPVPASALRNGADILAQYIPSVGRNSTIQMMQYDCQSVVSSCVYQNIQLSSYDCCKNLLSTSVASPAGLCWILHDRSMIQNSTGPDKQFTIIFQIPRNSWYASYFPQHPGVDVFLVEGGGDASAVGIYLENPIHLKDKKGVRLKMHKESRAYTRRPECGQALGDSRRADRSAMENNKTALLMCNIMVSAKYCGCHPVMADMMAFDKEKFREFARMLEQTNVCGVEQYESCSRRYVDAARGEDPEIAVGTPGWDELRECKDKNHRKCLLTTFPGQVEEFDLPSEYQNTQDFVSRLTLQYDTMKVTEILESKDPNLYEMLSFVGYNLALWFCVGHILWSLYSMATDACCKKRTSKVSPSDGGDTGEGEL